MIILSAIFKKLYEWPRRLSPESPEMASSLLPSSLRHCHSSIKARQQLAQLSHHWSRKPPPIARPSRLLVDFSWSRQCRQICGSGCTRWPSYRAWRTWGWGSRGSGSGSPDCAPLWHPLWPAPLSCPRLPAPQRPGQSHPSWPYSGHTLKSQGEQLVWLVL